MIYVICLTAAEDILEAEGGGKMPKSSVLLADALPSLLVKFVSPYCVRIVPYRYLVTVAVALAAASLGIVAWAPTAALRLLGVVFCSISCGLGETTFLALTSYFDPKSVVAWSSGTGGAGLIGAAYYWFFSSVLALSMKSIFMIAMVLPLGMALTYSFLLKNDHREMAVATASPKEPPTSPASSSDGEDEGDHATIKIAPSRDEALGVWERIGMIRPLIWRYILPLLLVYYAEYCICQSVCFALLFPLTETPFANYSDHYKTYLLLYQVGVFISRTFGRFIRVRDCWIFVILQGAMVAILSTETIFSYLGSIYLVFALIIFVGLLGGAAYVTTFCNITDQVERRNLEFSMAFTAIADSLGILLAGLTCLAYEPFLCRHNTICTSLKNVQVADRKL